MKRIGASGGRNESRKVLILFLYVLPSESNYRSIQFTSKITLFKLLPKSEDLDQRKGSEVIFCFSSKEEWRSCKQAKSKILDQSAASSI